MMLKDLMNALLHNNYLSKCLALIWYSFYWSGRELLFETIAVTTVKEM